MKLRKELFWDINNRIPDFEQSAVFIISRIIEKGGWEEWKEMMKYYGEERVKEVVLQIRYIPKRRFNFLSLYFNIPKEKFRCYIWQQLNPVRWDY